ncbi:MAG: hypothetical protein D6706_16745, partial [Chloroflexi bacterium]
MKKYWKFAGLIAVLLAAVGLVVGAVAFAQEPTPTPEDTEPVAPDHPFGKGLGQEIFNREAIHQAIADTLGMSVEELEAARAEGKTIEELAAEAGVEMADIQAAVEEVRNAAIDQA